MKSKHEVIDKFMEFKALVENQLGRKIKILRSDNGLEYLNKSMKKYCAVNGITHQTTCVYTPQQNGVAERMNRTIIERAKCMLFDAKLPNVYWGEAVNTAVHVINRSCSSALENNTPEAIWTNKKVDISYMKIFGSKCMVHVPKEKRRKWSKKSTEMIFVGYSETQKGYRCINPVTKNITISRDVVFEEKAQVIEYQNNIINNENLIPEECEVLDVVKTGADGDDFIDLHSEDESFDDANDKTYVPSLSDGEINTPQQVRKSKRAIKPPYKSTYMSVSNEDEPTTVEEALKGQDRNKWKLAMEDEMNSLMKNNTWDLTELPSGKKPIQTKWVFKVKKDAVGNILKYKARLVAKGYTQRHHIDYEETFAPVVRYSSIRLLMALAVEYNLKIDQMDAITAFLQGEIDEEIYIQQPDGYDDGSGKMCRLNKAMYGLKQAGRMWNLKLETSLKKFGLTKSQMDPCIFYDNEMKLIVAIYVDDLLIFWKNENTLENLKNFLCKTFNMKDMGRATSCIGINIKQMDGAIELDQTNYIKDILKRFGMECCKSIGNPSDVNQKLSNEMSSEVITDEERNKIPYQQAVGSLLYLAQCTRPDIVYAVNDVSRFNSNYKTAHWKAVKRIFRYLKGTMDTKLKFEKDQNFEIRGYSDADWASDVDKRRSCTGYLFKLSNGAITWSSKRQQTVALSSTEAEYMAMSSATQEALWLKQLAEELDKNLRKPIKLFSDNQSAIKLSESEAYRPRSKHIDIRFHFIRDVLQKGKVSIHFVRSEENIADPLTKSVSKEKLNFCADQMGLIVKNN